VRTVRGGGEGITGGEEKNKCGAGSKTGRDARDALIEDDSEEHQW
jgi:hypothetical protein